MFGPPGPLYCFSPAAWQPTQPYGCPIRAGDVPQSFGVGLSNVGDDLFGSSGGPSPPPTVLCCAAHRTGPRVGVSGSSGAPAGFPWRCWLADETSVSIYRLGRA